MDVDKMQTKLATWAQDPGFRFDDIYNLVYDENWLRRAYGSVKSNAGSRTAGTDGQTMRDFEENLDENLKDLRKSLKFQSFDPKPVRRTYIPKSDGEQRPLGIPTIKDRIVQEALRMVLEPIYETDFSEMSFGFRPNRNTHDARMAVREAMVPAKHNYKPWVIDADIKGFFDNVDHQTLEQIIQDRITDQKLRDLIWGFLKAGVMEDGTYHRSTLGTPQGGIVSPVLANIYLNELDQWAKQWTDISTAEKLERRRRGKGNWRYARYADDFLFLTNGTRKRAETMLRRVETFVEEELNLTLSEEKTELVHAEDGVSFLGYRLKANDQTTGGVKRTVPKEATEDIKAKVRRATEGNTNVSIRAKLRAVSSILRGWANYYRYATDASQVFSDLDHFAWHRMIHWLAEKLQCSRKRLISQKLDNRDPISINGVTMTKVSTMSDYYTESYREKGHPYLEEANI